MKKDNLLCQRVDARYAFMKSMRLDYPLGLLCRVFQVSRNSYYAALERRPVFPGEMLGYTLGLTYDAGTQCTGTLASRTEKATSASFDSSFHRRSPYYTDNYRKLIEQFGMQACMSRKGNCYDNASIESFWGSLKNEMIHHHRYAIPANAETAIKEYIEIFYNRQRCHSCLGYLSSARFVENFIKQGLTD